MRDHDARRSVLEVPVEQGAIRCRRPQQAVYVELVKESQDRLDLCRVPRSMFEIQPDAIETSRGRVSNESWNEMAQIRDCGGSSVANARECFALSHLSVLGLVSSRNESPAKTRHSQDQTSTGESRYSPCSASAFRELEKITVVFHGRRAAKLPPTDCCETRRTRCARPWSCRCSQG